MPHFERHGRVAPDDFLETLRGFDAIFLGAVGWPARLPDHITLTPLIRLRQAFDLYACVRPARTFKGVRGPLRSDEPIDVVVVRENSEGEYVDNGGTLAPRARRTRWRCRRRSTRAGASSGSCVSRSRSRARGGVGWR